MKKRWSKIDDFDDYVVCENGEVFSIKKGIILKPSSWKGYKHVMLWRKGIPKKCFIHRLVAKAFIENVHKKPQVNHIDGNPSNNHVSNLEWVTQSENDIHSFKNLGRKGSALGKTGELNPLSKSVAAINVDTGYIKIYGSQAQASKDGFTPSAITRVLKGECSQHKGFIFKRI